MSVDKNLYDLEKSKNEVYLSPHKWSSTERRLLQVRYKDQKSFRAFEMNYSKWSVYNISNFEDIEILKYNSDGSMDIKLSGDTYQEESQDTYYENWCGNLEVKKLFKDWEDHLTYSCELEIFLEENPYDLDIEEVQSDIKCIIDVSDYNKLKEYLIKQ